MPINDGLPYLPAFVAAAEAGTFSEAAKRLRITQSAVSKQILALEKNIGATLFDRLPRQLVLTEAGEALATVAKVLLRQLAQVGDTIAGQQDLQPHGPIRIGTSDTIGAYLLPDWLRHIVAALPGVQPDLHVGEPEMLLADLQAGRLDLVVVSGVVIADVLEPWPLRADPLRLVASPDVAARQPGDRPLAAFMPPLVLPAAGQPWRRRLEREVFEPLSWHPEVGWTVNHVEGIKRFVRAGLGATLLPDHVVADDLAQGHLSLVVTATPLPTPSIEMVRHRHRRSGRVLEAVWDALRSIA
jgi:DNA-binding transcriptional LysR family regulator